MTAALAQIEYLPGISPDVYAPKDFEAIQQIVHAEAGIVLPPSKAMLVYSRLAPLVRSTNSGTFSVYVAHIKRDAGELHRAVCALTTNHTFFHRESHHFEHFASAARPQLLSALNGGGSARIWSAGCSSGEETWSLAMTLLGEDLAAGSKIAQRDILILATDIATHALTSARGATYSTEAMNAVPAGLLKAWTIPAGGERAIAPEVRDIVRFRSLNLLGEWPMHGTFDVIFCRNVMIYFDQQTKERLLERFAQQLKPGGYLYIGHSERVTGQAAAKLDLVGSTIYRKAAA